MPRDVEVKTAKEDTKSGTTIHYEVKNNTSAAITIELKEHPNDKDGKKMGDRKTQIITIPANGTVKTKMSFPKDLGKMRNTYTDVNHSPRQPTDPINGYVFYLDKMPVHPNQYGSGWNSIAFITPFPWRIVDAFGTGWQGQFEIQSVTGLPIGPGWELEVVYPGLGVPFSLPSNDRSDLGLMRVRTPVDVPEGTAVELSVLQRVVGAPDEMVYRVEQVVPLVVDTTPPTAVMTDLIPDPVNRTILVRAQGSDAVSGMGPIMVDFANSPGDLWGTARLYLPETGDPFDPSPILETRLGPFCQGQSVRTRISMSDGVGNVLTLPEQITPF
jgi:hypothetical protein